MIKRIKYDLIKKEMDSFDKTLESLLQGEPYESYGKNYDIAIQRVMENYMFFKFRILDLIK